MAFRCHEFAAPLKIVKHAPARKTDSLQGTATWDTRSYRTKYIRYLQSMVTRCVDVRPAGESGNEATGQFGILEVSDRETRARSAQSELRSADL